MMTVYGPLLKNERIYKVFCKLIIIFYQHFSKPNNTKNNESGFQKLISKVTEKTGNSTQFRIKVNSKCERTRTVSAFVEPLEFNPEKYINHDQNYLNSINNNIIKMKMMTQMDLQKQNGSIAYW